MTSLADQAGTGSYSYDVMDRIASESRTIAGIAKSMSYGYNLDGSIKTLTYPSRAVITYTPDSAGRMLSALDTGNQINYVTSATYGPDSALAGFVSGYTSSFVGITNSFSCNKRLQPVFMSASSPSQTVFSIGYDFQLGKRDNGNVYALNNNKDNTRSQTFTYDALNRLTSAQNSGTDCTRTTVNGKTEYWGNNYGYDPWGNLVSKSVTKCSAENLSITALANNQLSGYGYDAAGNMTSDPTDGVTATYDAENRIATATKNGVTTTYTYDDAGNRVEKSNAGASTVYWYLTPGIVAEADLSGNLKSEYVFFDGERVARKDFPSNAVFYYFSDHLKTASVITDSVGNIKSESDYYPWGGELQLTNNDSNHYKFTGKERDSETGLDYFGARYYSNGQGRFTSADLPLIDQHPADPQSWNLYSYVRNNPLRFTDPTGNSLQGCENVAICQEMEGQGTNNAAGTVTEAANQTPDPDELEEQAERGNPSKASTVPVWLLPEPPHNWAWHAGHFFGFTHTREEQFFHNLISHDMEMHPEKYPVMGDAVTPVGGMGGAAKVGSKGLTYLYARFSAGGKFLKWGVTDNLATRYTQKELAEGTLETVTQGSRKQMLRLERWLTERVPGPLNFESWAGAKYSERAVRAVERVLETLGFGTVP